MMTIEEKAKAYDEALEKARCYYEGANGNEDMITMTTTMFPELKESGDERIRKVLIEEFKKKLERGFEWKEGIPNNAVIAWLDKQGEQKSTEWSEEDERIRQDIENLIHFALEDGSAVSPAAHTTKEEAISWILFLKDRVQPQPKQEWSEEDEKKMRAIITIINSTSQSIICSIDQDRESLGNWLKSIKDKYIWKPSEEQLDALETAVSACQSNTLAGLYNTLKSL